MLAVRANDAALFTRLLQISEVRSTILSSPGKKYPMPLKWPVNLRPEPFEYGDVLELAAREGKSAMVNNLLQVQQVSDAIDTRGDYAQKVLLLLIRNGMPEALEALLQRPMIAKILSLPDKDGMTALHHAAQRGQRQAARLLLQKLPASASAIASPNREGKTAIDLAKEAKYDELADFLKSFARIRRVMGMQ